MHTDGCVSYPALAVVGDEVELVPGLKREAELEKERVVQRRQDAALREGVPDLMSFLGVGRIVCGFGGMSVKGGGLLANQRPLLLLDKSKAC